MRKMISFKLENLSDKQREIIDTWADGQANIQQSLANIVMHVVGFVGNDDVMDFDVQRKLHLIFANNEVGHKQVEQVKKVKDAQLPQPEKTPEPPEQVETNGEEITDDPYVVAKNFYDKQEQQGQKEGQ